MKEILTSCLALAKERSYSLQLFLHLLQSQAKVVCRASISHATPHKRKKTKLHWTELSNTKRERERERREYTVVFLRDGEAQGGSDGPPRSIELLPLQFELILRATRKISRRITNSLLISHGTC